MKNNMYTHFWRVYSFSPNKAILICSRSYSFAVAYAITVKWPSSIFSGSISEAYLFLLALFFNSVTSADEDAKYRLPLPTSGNIRLCKQSIFCHLTFLMIVALRVLGVILRYLIGMTVLGLRKVDFEMKLAVEFKADLMILLQVILIMSPHVRRMIAQTLTLTPRHNLKLRFDTWRSFANRDPIPIMCSTA